MWNVTSKELLDCKDTVEKNFTEFKKDSLKNRHDYEDSLDLRLLDQDHRIDERNTDIALLKQSSVHMEKERWEIKDMLKEFKKDLYTQFATKAEFEKNQDRLDWFTKFAWIVASIIIAAILGWILKLIIV